MKKYLLFSMALSIMASVSITNVFAIGLGSQSINVTVGEVEKTNADDEEQKVYVPNTGIFGLESDKVPVVITAVFAMPVAVILVCLFGYIHHKQVKKSSQ